MAASAHPIINISLNGKLTTNGDRSIKFYLIMPCQKSSLFSLSRAGGQAIAEAVS